MRFLKLFTTLPLAEIAKLAALQGRRDQRGQEGAGDGGDRAAARPRQGRGGRRDRAQDVRAGRARAEGLPTVEIARRRAGRSGIGVLTAFVQAGLVESNGEARRQIQGGGLQASTTRPVADDEGDADSCAIVAADGVIKLSLGKKKHVLLEAGLAGATRRGCYSACSSSSAMRRVETSRRRCRRCRRSVPGACGRLRASCSKTRTLTHRRRLAGRSSRRCTFGSSGVIWKMSRKMPGASIDSGLTITSGLSIAP